MHENAKREGGFGLVEAASGDLDTDRRKAGDCLVGHGLSGPDSAAKHPNVRDTGVNTSDSGNGRFQIVRKGYLRMETPEVLFPQREERSHLGAAPATDGSWHREARMEGAKGRDLLRRGASGRQQEGQRNRFSNLEHPKILSCSRILYFGTASAYFVRWRCSSPYLRDNAGIAAFSLRIAVLSSLHFFQTGSDTARSGRDSFLMDSREASASRFLYSSKIKLDHGAPAGF